MLKTEYSQVMDLGFTPIYDFASECYPKDCDRVLGKIARYASLASGKCFATRERIAKELGITPKTFDKKVVFLEAQGMVVDETPDMRNHSHSYFINYKRIFEEIDLYNEYKGTGEVEIVISDGEDGVVCKNLTVKNLHTGEEILHTGEEILPSGYVKITHEEIEYSRDELKDQENDLEACASPEPEIVADAPISSQDLEVANSFLKEFQNILNGNYPLGDNLFSCMDSYSSKEEFLKTFRGNRDLDKVNSFLESTPQN